MSDLCRTPATTPRYLTRRACRKKGLQLPESVTSPSGPSSSSGPPSHGRRPAHMTQPRDHPPELARWLYPDPSKDKQVAKEPTPSDGWDTTSCFSDEEVCSMDIDHEEEAEEAEEAEDEQKQLKEVVVDPGHAYSIHDDTLPRRFMHVLSAGCHLQHGVLNDAAGIHKVIFGPPKPVDDGDTRPSIVVCVNYSRELCPICNRKYRITYQE